MKLFKMFKRGQRGFTLVELMVVMAIIAVLAAIVVPAVTGTKEVSESGQMKSDASALRSGITNFQNASLTSSWPEIGAPQISSNATAMYIPAETSILPAGRRAAITVGIRLVTGGPTHTEICWNAGTYARQSDEKLPPQALYLVPDFVDKQPASVRTLRTIAGGTNLHEYIWLLAIEAQGTSQETRVLEGYKLDAPGTHYAKIY